MGNVSQHEEKIAHNRGLFAQLKSQPDSFVDWQITIVFYCALHCVERYFADQNPPIHYDKHFIRKRAVSNAFPQDIAKQYLHLESISRTARYDALSHKFLKPFNVEKCLERIDKVAKFVKC